MQRGQRLTLTVERPAAGGRMIARHEGAVVFVAGAIPGEVVEADVEKVQRGTAWAVARAVLTASPDRVAAPSAAPCGGTVLAHIRYERQLAIKAAIIEDAFRRLARLPLDAPPDVVASPVDGHRMRARVHVRDGRIGFYREGSHALCDAADTRQLRPDTVDVLRALEGGLASLGSDMAAHIEIAENLDASERALHLELAPGADPARLAAATRVAGVTGVSCAAPGGPTIDLWGTASVRDEVAGATIVRHARSFFQGNRYLLLPLVDHVVSMIERGPVLDLYAGVGLFSLAAATAGLGPVTAVEGDPSAAADLRHNARQAEGLVARHESVEEFLSGRPARPGTVVVDPPRTGLSKAAQAGIVALGAERVVYVSCDVATLARDARVLADAGYGLTAVRAFDLFPTTAHVETVIVFSRPPTG